MSPSATRRFRLNLYLDKRNGWLAGVCAGIAARTGIDRAVIRIATVVAGLLLPTLTLAVYVTAWLVLEERPARV